MLLSRIALSICALVWLGDAVSAVSTQGYPNRPIRIVAGVSTSAASAMARLVAQEISVTLGQPIIIENRGGGNGPGVIVSKALPDGYTLLNSGSGFWLAPLM